MAVLLVEVNLGLVHRRLYLIQVNSLSFYLLPELAFSSGREALFQEGRVESVECKV